MSEIPFYPDEITIEERVKEMRRLCQEVRIEQEADRVRIADLEKQLAEETAKREEAVTAVNHFARQLAEVTKRAETAEADRNWYRSVAHNNGGELFDKMHDEKRRAEAAEKRVTELVRLLPESWGPYSANEPPRESYTELYNRANAAEEALRRFEEGTSDAGRLAILKQDKQRIAELQAEVARLNALVAILEENLPHNVRVARELAAKEEAK